MRRVLFLVLTVMLLLSLCACGGSDEKKPEGLQVGFGKVDVTPNFSVGLGGYADAETRRSDGVFSKIYMTCVAISEEDQTVLLYTMDFVACSETMAGWLRDKVSPETGIPKENIFCGATHNHSGPALDMADPEGLRYREVWKDAAVAAAKEALADMAAATILSGQQEIEGMNFVRHYKMQDGTYAGSNFGSFSNSPIIGHTVEGDHKMTLVKFDRPEGKEDVLLVNWAAHPDHGHTIGRNNISADFPGFLRDKIEADTGMKVAYFTGASGNMNPDSKIQDEKHNLDVKAYGEKLAELAIAALPSLTPVESSGIKLSNVNVALDVDHSWEHLLKEAENVYQISHTDTSSALGLCRTYNFSHYLQARAIIRRSTLAQTENKALHAFCVGGIGFVNGDYEMFTESGMYIKENSPFETTFIVTGCSGYIATEAAFEYRSYEADCGTYAKGTAEKLAEKYVEMLKSFA